MLHEHGSNNPNGVTSNGDRYAMHPYFIFKDLVTIFAFFLVLSVLVFFYPNLLGLQTRGRPNVILLIVNITYICAICWENINKYKKLLYLIKIHNKTVIVSGLFIIIILRKYIIVNINPVIVKYYYEIFNQQITKILNNFSNFCINFLYFNDYCLLLVGISETLRTHKKNIIKPQIKFIKSNNINHHNNLIFDNHNKEISLKFKQWFAGLTDGDGYIYVNKKGFVGFELTLQTHDEKVLRIIQNKFGGTVHARGGLKAVRYRTQRRDVMYKIIQCLNGFVINNVRLVQLHKACLALNIPIKEPIVPDINSAYISGLLDSDGSIKHL